MKRKKQAALDGQNKRNQDSPEVMTITSDELKHFLLKALFALEDNNYEAAQKAMSHYEGFDNIFFQAYPYLYYYKALLAYGQKDYDSAERFFLEYIEKSAVDEMAYFHLGNVYFRKQEWNNALESYNSALDMRKDFPEVLVNIGLIARQLGDEATAKAVARDQVIFEKIFVQNAFCENPLEYALAIPQTFSVSEIPIFINSRDRLGTLKILLDWLKRAGQRRIYILDNDSTYPDLLEFYRHLDENESTVQVLRLKKNFGHTALWDSKVLEILHVDTPYVYTDSDVVPSEDCPLDVLGDLMQVLRKYPFLKKVGLALKTDDITYFDAEKTREAEKRFYLYEIEPELYFGAVDTTFALYRNYRHYNLYVSARTTGKKTARHLPWYYDYGNLPEDERYYMAHANESATLVQRVKSEWCQGDCPLVSVVMPVYNAQDYLAEAIESIINQTYANWELLAINDGSTDDSLSILEGYMKIDKRIKILTHEHNKGLPAARNTGIKNSNGKYIMLMDADDISVSKRMERQVGFMEKENYVDLCGTFAKTIGTEQSNIWKKPLTDKEIKLNLLIVCPFITPSVMIRRKSLFKYQLYFDETWRIVEDYEFWSRASSKLIYSNLPEVLYLYRLTPQSLSRGNPRQMTTATHAIIAQNLNAISTRRLELPALNKSDADNKDLQKTIVELQKLSSCLKEDCMFSKEEVKVVTDYLVQQCEQVLVNRKINK